MKPHSINLSLALCSLALTATEPVVAVTAATVLEDADFTLIDGQVREELDLARSELDRANQELEQAHAAIAGTLGQIDVAEPAEPPEPPEPPEVPALPDINAIVNGAMAQVHTALGGPLSGSAGTPLIVAAEIDAARQGEFQEDLNVMSRILVKAANKASGGAKSRTAMGIRLQLPFGQTGPSSLYIEDFGAVFFLNVNYPLVAPSTKGEPKAEPEKPTDTVWEEARAELYGGPQGKRSTGLALPGTPTGGQLEYNAGRVDVLKAALLEAAKNAVNIRHLKPGEHIVVVVQGTGHLTPNHADARMLTRHGSRVAGLAKSGTESTLLTVRFKKTDAEAAAQGKLSPEEFAKKTALWTR